MLTLMTTINSKDGIFLPTLSTCLSGQFRYKIIQLNLRWYSHNLSSYNLEGSLQETL